MKRFSITVSERDFNLLESGVKKEVYMDILSTTDWVTHGAYGPLQISDDELMKSSVFERAKQLLHEYSRVTFYHVIPGKKIDFEIKGLKVGKAIVEFGEDPTKNYFILKLGVRLHD